MKKVIYFAKVNIATSQVYDLYNGQNIYNILSPVLYRFNDQLAYEYEYSFIYDDKIIQDKILYSVRIKERTDTYSRYLIKYDIYSLPMLDNYVSLEELENKLGKSYEEINEDKSIKVDVLFKFKYE